MSEIEIQTLSLSQWQEYKDIRLRSLKTEPQAFLSRYEESASFPDEKWQQRLPHLDWRMGNDGRSWCLPTVWILLHIAWSHAGVDRLIRNDLFISSRGNIISNPICNIQYGKILKRKRKSLKMCHTASKQSAHNLWGSISIPVFLQRAQRKNSDELISALTNSSRTWILRELWW